jgi:hypothetical protein
MHEGRTVSAETKKPEDVEFYNSMKRGVDTFDQMRQFYLQ